MNTVTVSPKYQVVIPQKIRQALDIQPGHKMLVLEYGAHIVMIPIRSIEEARGFVQDINKDPHREKVDREI